MTSAVSPLSAKAFCDRGFSRSEYTPESAHAQQMPEPIEFVRVHKLESKKVLEVGCGRGVYQNLIPEMTKTRSLDSGRVFDSVLVPTHLLV